jgi:hypothetical protein
MRLLFAIPHFFDPEGDPWHGPGPRDPEPRIAALTAAVSALHAHFGRRQYLPDVERRTILRANARNVHEVDVVICTTGGLHLLDQAPLPTGAYLHRRTDAEAALLGFECQAVLREGLGEYDWYCYLEHDVVVHDSLLFVKLGWFNGWAGDAALLLPNRYERDAEAGGRKAYVDPRIPESEAAPFQDTADDPVFVRTVMGMRVVFYRPTNPHAGCYFLNERQFSRWVESDHFLERDTSFVGAPESAGSLGVMRTFKVYKPAPGCAGFLEVEHADPRFIAKIGLE